MSLFLLVCFEAFISSLSLSLCGSVFIQLEKAFHEKSGENAEAKFMFDKKLAEIHSLEASIGDRYLKIKGKLHSADARLAQESRKSSEMDRKLDVEAYEHELQKESTAFTTGYSFCSSNLSFYLVY